ncbi:MAG: DUF3300 domain-containing protein, partial [Acetobacteraceae bacterium]|nr:DUF3300 domain-containing protein [Acetobacteraceae bacterium]
MAAQSVPGLTRGRLEQLVAPVALYPDRLLAPVLMAATQPLDILRAERWLARGGNATLRGDELAAAIEGEPWDPAVKALVPFPDVLRMMSRNLDWTEALGDAVAEREADVMHAVQALRRRARAGGFLRSGEEWEVSTAPWDAPPPERPWIVEPPAEAILIEPRRREDVRVPVYDPRVVYGGWDWAEHPPPYQPPPVSYGLAPALGASIAFLGGVAVASALWGWARPAWGRGILVDAPRWQRLAPGRPRFAGEYWRPVPRGHAVGRHRAWSGQFRAPG